MSYIWRNEYVEVLNEQLALGKTHALIAQEINTRFGTDYCRKLERAREKAGAFSNSHWSNPVKTRLVELYNSPDGMSFLDITERLNKEFDTTYSRSSVIGQASRLGLSGKKAAAPVKRSYKPRLRIVSANSNSTKKRVIHSVESTETVALRCVEIVPRALTFLQLEENDCRYAYGDVPADLTFCGHEKQKGSSYCVAHHALCFTPATPPKPRAWINLGRGRAA